MKQTYYLELNKEELTILKQSCNVSYQIYKENWSFKNMIKIKGIERRLKYLDEIK